ncbi:MAG: hypothetical protein KHX56_13560 [Clostridiales bacterium]|nr:hypothetical protein [Clostridiales bacterium]
MTNRVWQLKKIFCNIVAWLLIWLIAVLAIPVGIIMLIIYCVRTVSDRVIRKMNGGHSTVKRVESGNFGHKIIEKHS